MKSASLSEVVSKAQGVRVSDADIGLVAVAMNRYILPAIFRSKGRELDAEHILETLFETSNALDKDTEFTDKEAYVALSALIFSLVGTYKVALHNMEQEMFFKKDEPPAIPPPAAEEAKPYDPCSRPSQDEVGQIDTTSPSPVEYVVNENVGGVLPASGRLSRADIYIAIDEERAYQRKEHPVGETSSLGDNVLLLTDYVEKARIAWSYHDKAGFDDVRNELRKIAAIAVRALELHGVRTRAEEENSKAGGNPFAAFFQ